MLHDLYDGFNREGECNRNSRTNHIRVRMNIHPDHSRDELIFRFFIVGSLLWDGLRLEPVMWFDLFCWRSWRLINIQY